MASDNDRNIRREVRRDIAGSEGGGLGKRRMAYLDILLREY